MKWSMEAEEMEWMEDDFVRGTNGIEKFLSVEIERNIQSTIAALLLRHTRQPSALLIQDILAQSGGTDVAGLWDELSSSRTSFYITVLFYKIVAHFATSAANTADDNGWPRANFFLLLDAFLATGLRNFYTFMNINPTVHGSHGCQGRKLVSLCNIRVYIRVLI